MTRQSASRMLKQMLDLATYPDDEGISLAATILNNGCFEFARTPNCFPIGRLTFTGAGVLTLPAATAVIIGGTSTNPADLAPADGMYWRVLGCMLQTNQAGNVKLVLREQGGGRTLATFNPFVGLPTVARTPIYFGSTGAALHAGSSLEFVVDAAYTIDFQFWVAEESGIIARGGA